MTNKRNWLIAALIVGLAVVAVYQNVSAGDQAASVPTETAPRPNYLAPTLALEGLDGQSYQVGGTRDKVLLINFWASWCGPCELEAPDLKRLADKYKDGMELYAINVTSQDRMDNVNSFVKHFGFDFPVLLDPDGQASDTYRIRGLPTTFLVDRNGVITDAFNLLNPDELEKRIKELLAK
ncbi:TlpA family protein disulfide reductase [Paenibacillus koleovorans]|uniref:TlpA family protein disulfide reductase n=1 Tax=Paenibacillus koleovorans TaxID=121608 RepID=UPI000FDBE853|nr:TlpA disulfide reductase family protein [Paenibacillus koleovorans]